MAAAGRARRASGNGFPLIGVAPAREIPPRGKTPVDPNHSHLVAVDDPSAPAHDSWGSETEAMYWLFAKLAEGRPSVTIVANGGGITLKEVESNVRAGRRMILIEGSGRAADALVSLLQKTKVANPEVVGLRDSAEKATLTRRPELFTIVPLQGGAPSLRDAITAGIRSPSPRNDRTFRNRALMLSRHFVTAFRYRLGERSPQTPLSWQGRHFASGISSMPRPFELRRRADELCSPGCDRSLDGFIVAMGIRRMKTFPGVAVSVLTTGTAKPFSAEVADA
jgi:hypothetical protein